MANWIRFFTQSPDDVEEDDFFPALLAETHPLPPSPTAVPWTADRLPADVWLYTFSLDPVRKERAA